jgi:hypothetical protein
VYRQSLATLRRAFPVLALLALLGAAVEYIEPRLPRALAAFVVYALAAFFAHRASLLDERLTLGQALRGRDAAGRWLPLPGFLWRAAGFMALLAALTLGLGWGLAVYAEVPERLLRAVVVGGILLGVGLHGILLSYTGTMLPAAAVGGDASLATAWARGRQTFGRTLGRLAFGPLLFMALTVAVFIVLDGTIGAVEGLRLALRRLLGASLAVMATVLAATALCVAYTDRRPD